MLTQTYHTAREKHSRIARKQTLENQESDREIREAINAGSATSFVTSRLRYFQTERGLNTSLEVR